jgi:hypothetical protein
LGRRGGPAWAVLLGTLIGMASSASENIAAELLAYVGSEPAEKVLREAGIVATEAGKQRWRELLSRPIPAEALAEGRRWRDEIRTEAHGEAA